MAKNPGVTGKVNLTNKKNNTKPKAAGGKPKPMGIGMDPKKMAQTMTDLGYGGDISAIQREIAYSQAQEAQALKDLQGWASQIEEQRAAGAAAGAAAWDQSIAQNQQSNANINQLFGGPNGEAAAYGGVGESLLGALSASDKSFDARMQPILGAQAMDYNRRAQNDFRSEQKDLKDKLLDLQHEKALAYQKNLMDAMNMAWARKQDVLQYQTGQQALAQARRMGNLEYKQGLQQLQQGKQSIVQGGQTIKQNAQELKAQKLAIRKSQIELKKLVQNPNGVDWNDPATRSNIGNAALSGSLSPRNTFGVSPKIAEKNAMIALAQMGLASDRRAVAAVHNALIQILNLSHAHKQWTKWKLNKKGQIIFAPASKPKAVIKKTYHMGPKNAQHPQGKYYDVPTAVPVR